MLIDMSILCAGLNCIHDGAQGNALTGVWGGMLQTACFVFLVVFVGYAVRHWSHATPLSMASQEVAMAPPLKAVDGGHSDFTSSMPPDSTDMLDRPLHPHRCADNCWGFTGLISVLLIAFVSACSFSRYFQGVHTRGLRHMHLCACVLVVSTFCRVMIVWGK